MQPDLNRQVAGAPWDAPATVGRSPAPQWENSQLGERHPCPNGANRTAGPLFFYPQQATLTPRSCRILTIQHTGGGNLDIPNFRSVRILDLPRSGIYSDTLRGRATPAGSIGVQCR
jgi:hypothetical protein